MRTDVLLDRGEKRIIAVSTQDVEPILERNRMLRGERQLSDFGRHVANIPNVARKLQDPDWKHLRVDK